MSVPSCFTSIIGFSRKEDDCVSDAWDASYATSDSGLYVDELPGFPQRFVASLGGNYDIWEKMTNALENAIGSFKLDVLQAILKYKEPVRTRFKGDIGGKSFTNTITSCVYQGLRMYSDIIGGAYILRGFYLILDAPEIVTLEIYDEYDKLYTYVLNITTAGKPIYTAITPLSLPLDRNYYFLYQTSGKAYNNKLTCNCGGYHWCFSPHSPCYGPSRDNWTNWAMVAGVCGDVLTERDDWGTYHEAKGLILHGEFNCDVLGSLCNEYSDFTGANEIDYAIAFALWYKTGAYLAISIMDTEEVSRRPLLGTEQWNANMLFYNEKYQGMIDFIAENFEEDRNECLKCRDPFGFNITSQIL